LQLSTVSDTAFAFDLKVRSGLRHRLDFGFVFEGDRGVRHHPCVMRSHAALTQVLSLVIAALGIALLVRTLAEGGGQVGILLGLLFLGLGAGRFYLARKVR
jgi:hypothetical protein